MRQYDIRFVFARGADYSGYLIGFHPIAEISFEHSAERTIIVHTTIEPELFKASRQNRRHWVVNIAKQIGRRSSDHGA